MCISDWRLGRLIRSEVVAIDTSVNATPSIAANPDRVMLLWSLANTTSLTAGLVVSMDGQPLFVLNSSQPLLWLRLSDHGRICQHSYSSVKVGAANVTGSIISFTLPESVIQDEIERFTSGYRPYKG